MADRRTRKKKSNNEIDSDSDGDEGGRVAGEVGTWRMPPQLEPKQLVHVNPTVFDESTRVRMPSISPRDPIEAISDKKVQKKNEKYLANQPRLGAFIRDMQLAIIENKPEDIVKYLADEYFAKHRLGELHVVYYPR